MNNEEMSGLDQAFNTVEAVGGGDRSKERNT